jgi:hypothetical protein
MSDETVTIGTGTGRDDLMDCETCVAMHPKGIENCKCDNCPTFKMARYYSWVADQLPFWKCIKLLFWRYFKPHRLALWLYYIDAGMRPEDALEAVEEG